MKQSSPHSWSSRKPVPLAVHSLYTHQGSNSFLHIYLPSIIDSAIARALLIPRAEALKKLVAEKMNRVVFVTTFHPALPFISNILNKAWKVMTNDSYLKDVFPSPPMIAFKQARNSSLRNLLVKAKLPKLTRNRRMIVGMNKCRKTNCCCGPDISEHCIVESSATKFKVELS